MNTTMKAACSASAVQRVRSACAVSVPARHCCVFPLRSPLLRTRAVSTPASTDSQATGRTSSYSASSRPEDAQASGVSAEESSTPVLSSTMLMASISLAILGAMLTVDSAQASALAGDSSAVHSHYVPVRTIQLCLPRCSHRPYAVPSCLLHS